MVVSRILQDQQLLPLLPEREKHIIVEFTLHLLQTYATHKLMGYHLTTLLMVHAMLPLSSLHTILDRINYHIEHLESIEECAALSQLIKNIIQHPSEDFQMKLNATFPRVLSTCVKLTSSENTRMFGFQLIKELIESKNISSQLLSHIRNLCLDHLDQPIYHPSITQIFAYSTWHASYDELCSSWSLLCSYIHQCLRHLGISKPIDSSYLALHSSLSAKITSKSGVSKTILLENIIQGLFQIMIKMLNTGNPNFFISLEITSLIDILNVLLPYSVEATALNLDTTMITENHSHVSPAAILLILPHMKFDCILLIHALILNYHHACVSCMPTILRLLSISFSLHQAKHPSLTDQLLTTLILVISSFPSLISQVANPMTLFHSFSKVTIVWRAGRVFDM